MKTVFFIFFIMTVKELFHHLPKSAEIEVLHRKLKTAIPTKWNGTILIRIETSIKTHFLFRI